VKLLFFLRKKFHKKEIRKSVIETEIKLHKARYHWIKGRFAKKKEYGWKVTRVDVVFGIEKINNEFYVYRKLPNSWRMGPPAKRKESYKIGVDKAMLAYMLGDDETIIDIFEKQKRKVKNLGE